MSMSRAQIVKPGMLPLLNLPYVAQGIFFNGAAGIRGVIQPSSNTSKISFAGWFRSAWQDVGAPLWVTDPKGNSNPYLKTTTTTFVASEAAFENVNGFTGGPEMFWSVDGQKWNSANFNNNYPAMQLFGGNLGYANGSWMIKYADNANNELGVYYLSTDAKNWSIVFKETSQQFSGLFGFDTASNRWRISLSQPSPSIVYINIANPPNSNFIPDDEPGYFADKSQTNVTDPNHIANNRLPPGWTAIRFGFTNNFAFDYTTTPLSAAIVSSGAGWPGAKWTTVFTFTNSDPHNTDSSNNQISLGLPSGTTGGNNLIFSQGDGVAGDTAFIQNTNLVPQAWMHFMGSIDGSLGQAVFVINGQVAGQVPTLVGNPFSSISTNLKNFYFGEDTLGNFYTGDMADVSIWFDVSWISGGTISQNIIHAFIQNGNPVDPATGIFSTLQGTLMLGGLPQFFISGPASLLFGENARNNLVSLDRVVPDAGFVGDSTSNPSLGSPT